MCISLELQSEYNCVSIKHSIQCINQYFEESIEKKYHQNNSNCIWIPSSHKCKIIIDTSYGIRSEV